MKILITGSNGQLGNELQKIVATGTAEIGSVSEEIKNSEVFAMDVDTLDITNLEQGIRFSSTSKCLWKN